MELTSGSGDSATKSQAPLSVAIIGASGFVGLRTTEILSSQSEWTVRAVVRAASSLAVLARQRLDWRIVNFLSASELQTALDGCDVCVHAAIGDSRQIVDMAKAAYRACLRSGVKRLVWLSSASVHGQNAPLGTDETTPLNDRQPLLYNNAKVRAEWALEQLSRDGYVEVVRLRPSVVYGPRARWISEPAEALRANRAAWINEGRGVCNSIYIDNLVSAICLSARIQNAAGHAFLVGDGETVTWREFMLSIAKHLGFDDTAFENASIPAVVPERDNLLTELTMSQAYVKCGRRVPDRAKRIVKGVIKGWMRPQFVESGWHLRGMPSPTLNTEMALLQQCEWVLPTAKARQILDYNPRISFKDGMQRSLKWLDFIQ
jgi:nucleoside-diphosphate-sugar epimerase